VNKLYLTYDEYSNLSSNPLPLDKFNSLLASASFTLDSITNYFYIKVDLENDYPQRRDAFKRAVAVTMDYYTSKGGTEMFTESTAQSVTIGRTSMSEGNSASGGLKSPYGNVPIDVSFILGPTGLLYKGVNTIC